MMIVSGSSSGKLAGKVAKELNLKLAKIELRRFPDGECYCRVLDKLSGEVVLVQNAYPDENIIELFLLQDAIKEFEIERLITIIPYLGYARQDKKFKVGEPISARALLRRVDADKLLTIDVHNLQVLEYFKGEAKNISGIPAIARYLNKLDIDIILAPDRGALARAKKCAGILGCEYDYLEKRRLSSTKVELAPKSLPVRGKNVGILDDIISTGATINEAAKFLREQKAAKIYATCTHGLFVEDALKKLNQVCDGVCSTDTVESAMSAVSVAGELAPWLRVK